MISIMITKSFNFKVIKETEVPFKLNTTLQHYLPIEETNEFRLSH